MKKKRFHKAAKVLSVLNTEPTLAAQELREIQEAVEESKHDRLKHKLKLLFSWQVSKRYTYAILKDTPELRMYTVKNESLL